MKYPLHDYLVPRMEKTKFSEWTSKNMDRVYDKACRGSEVPLRALWCKARGIVVVVYDKPLREEKQEKKI